MSRRESSVIRALAEKYVCPSCDAGIGDRCRARTRWSDRARAPHETRVALAQAGIARAIAQLAQEKAR